MKVYKIQQIGNSYYLAIPKPLISSAMLEQGVQIKAIEYSEDRLIIEISVSSQVPHAMNAGGHEHGEHTENHKASRENSP